MMGRYVSVRRCVCVCVRGTQAEVGEQRLTPLPHLQLDLRPSPSTDLEIKKQWLKQISPFLRAVISPVLPTCTHYCVSASMRQSVFVEIAVK